VPISFCDAPVRGTEGYGREHGPAQQQDCTMFKKGSAWVRLGGMGKPLGSSASSSQTKSGRSIPGHMAQFAGITCLEMWGLCPRLF
jgi:hypothetical protein